MKNTESFKKINIEFNNFENSKKLNSDENNDEEDLITKDISVIKNQ